MALAGLLQVLLFNLYTILTLEIVNRNPYIIVSLIGALLGVVLFTAIITILFTSAGDNLAITIILVQPIMMACMAITNSVAEGVYGWYYRTYGSDSLSQYQETYEHEQEI